MPGAVIYISEFQNIMAWKFGISVGSSPVNAMGSNAPTPLTTTTIKTTEDAIKFFRLLRVGCRMRGLEW